MVGRDAARALPRVHSANQHFKTWLRGPIEAFRTTSCRSTSTSSSSASTVRRTPMAAFQTLLGLGSRLAPTTYEGVRDAWPCGANRIGRSWPYLHQAEPH